MKNESTRTIAYLVAAGVALGLALLLSPRGELTPQELIEFKVGTEFYKDFTNPNDATSITVVGWDEASATSRKFAVNFQNGKWTIPSHHNYPADGQDRLAKTASSVMGIKREELASTSKQAHETLGVIDPLDKDRPELKGRGQHLILKRGEDTLVDMIIGNQVKNRSGFYYVRRADEDATFVAKLDINLSTKFSEWIETDLLKLNRDDLKEIVVDNYSIDKRQGVIVAGDISKLERDKVADPWKLEGLDESKEEVDVSKVNSMLGALDDLKIVGVRPKPKGLNPDLTLDTEFVKKQDDLMRLRLDLQDSGFALAPDRQKKRLLLYSDQGDLTASTNKGVTYTLRFGDVFLGDETEIEIGGASNKDAKKDADKKEDEEKKQGDEQNDKPKEKDSPGKQSSRYLFVTASFDESLLGPKPEKPAPFDEQAAASDDAADAAPKKTDTSDAKTPDEKPADDPATEEKPSDESSGKPSVKSGEDTSPCNESDDGAKASETVDDDSKSVATGDDEPAKKEDAQPDSSEKKKNEDAGDAAEEEKKPEAGAEKEFETEKKAEPKKEEPKKSAADLKKEFDEKLKKYEADLKSYEDKVATGKKQVDELNARFSGWYYVISAEYFNKLHLSRKELVKDKSKPADGKAATDPVIPPQDEPDADFPERDAKDKDKDSDRPKDEATEPKDE
jgi:hypothetical protein